MSSRHRPGRVLRLTPQHVCIRQYTNTFSLPTPHVICNTWRVHRVLSLRDVHRPIHATPQWFEYTTSTRITNAAERATTHWDDVQIDVNGLERVSRRYYHYVCNTTRCEIESA